MKKSKIFAALALSACMTLGTVGLTACSSCNGDGGTSSTTDTRIMEVYDAYVASAKANGEKALDYEEWYADLLANAKGAKGDKGDTGAQGEKGDKGADGNTWLVGTTAPTAENGKDGDLYLDYTTWNVYHKVSGAWVLLGNIKGADGATGEGGSQGGEDPEEPKEEIVSVVGQFTIASYQTSEEIIGYNEVGALPSGGYYICAETDSAPAKGVLTFNNTNGVTFSTDMYMPLANKYRAYFDSDKTGKCTIANNSAHAITVNVKIVKYVGPTIEEGKEYDIPANSKSAGVVPINIDPSLAGKEVTVTISNWDTKATMCPLIYDGVKTTTKLFIFTESHKISDGVYQMTGTIPEGTTSLIFQDNNAPECRNIAVKIELVK